LFKTYLLKPVTTTLLGQHVYSSFRVSSHLHSGAIPHRWSTGYLSASLLLQPATCNFRHHSSPTFCRQNVLLLLLLCNKSVCTNIYGGTKPQNFENSKTFGALFWGHFGILGAITPFSIRSCALGLTTSPSPKFRLPFLLPFSR